MDTFGTPATLCEKGGLHPLELRKLTERDGIRVSISHDARILNCENVRIVQAAVGPSRSSFRCLIHALHLSVRFVERDRALDVAS